MTRQKPAQDRGRVTASRKADRRIGRLTWSVPERRSRDNPVIDRVRDSSPMTGEAVSYRVPPISCRTTGTGARGGRDPAAAAPATHEVAKPTAATPAESHAPLPLIAVPTNPVTRPDDPQTPACLRRKRSVSVRADEIARSVGHGKVSTDGGRRRSPLNPSPPGSRARRDEVIVGSVPNVTGACHLTLGRRHFSARFEGCERKL